MRRLDTQAHTSSLKNSSKGKKKEGSGMIVDGNSTKIFVRQHQNTQRSVQQHTSAINPYTRYICLPSLPLKQDQEKEKKNEQRNGCRSEASPIHIEKRDFIDLDPRIQRRRSKTLVGSVAGNNVKNKRKILVATISHIWGKKEERRGGNKGRINHVLAWRSCHGIRTKDQLQIHTESRKLVWRCILDLFRNILGTRRH